ncbi:ABC transporter substrate-binding protein, partial [Rhizobiaceae sp. 2RAB30]
MLLATGLSTGAIADPSGTLRWGVGFDSTGWNPQVQAGTVYTQLVFEGLLQMAADGVTIQPRLAESWSITPTEATFKLRQGVKFHNGADFTADDVVASMKRVSDPASPLRGNIPLFVGAAKVDDHTVDIE